MGRETDRVNSGTLDILKDVGTMIRNIEGVCRAKAEKSGAKSPIGWDHYRDRQIVSVLGEMGGMAEMAIRILEKVSCDD